MTPGQHLRSLRHTRSLTLNAVADEIGISTSYLNDLEHDRRPHGSVTVVTRLADFYRVPIDVIVRPDHHTDNTGHLDVIRRLTTDLGIAQARIDTQAALLGHADQALAASLAQDAAAFARHRRLYLDRRRGDA